MNILRATLISVVVLYACAASARERADWPRRTVGIKDLTFAAVETAKLPRPLYKWIASTGDTFGVAEELPESIDIARVDLNHDGREEFFVESRLGGTGGTHQFIFQITGSRCRELGEVQGELYFCQRENGYYQIEVWSHAGGMQWTRSLLRYDGGQYRVVRKEEYRGFDESDAHFVQTLAIPREE